MSWSYTPPAVAPLPRAPVTSCFQQESADQFLDSSDCEPACAGALSVRSSESEQIASSFRESQLSADVVATSDSSGGKNDAAAEIADTQAESQHTDTSVGHGATSFPSVPAVNKASAYETNCSGGIEPMTHIVEFSNDSVTTASGTNSVSSSSNTVGDRSVDVLYRDIRRLLSENVDAALHESSVVLPVTQCLHSPTRADCVEYTSPPSATTTTTGDWSSQPVLNTASTDLHHYMAVDTMDEYDDDCVTDEVSHDSSVVSEHAGHLGKSLVLNDSPTISSHNSYPPGPTATTQNPNSEFFQRYSGISVSDLTVDEINALFKDFDLDVESQHPGISYQTARGLASTEMNDNFSTLTDDSSGRVRRLNGERSHRSNDNALSVHSNKSIGATSVTYSTITKSYSMTSHQHTEAVASLKTVSAPSIVSCPVVSSVGSVSDRRQTIYGSSAESELNGERISSVKHVEENVSGLDGSLPVSQPSANFCQFPASVSPNVSKPNSVRRLSFTLESPSPIVLECYRKHPEAFLRPRDTGQYSQSSNTKSNPHSNSETTLFTQYSAVTAASESSVSSSSYTLLPPLSMSDVDSANSDQQQIVADRPRRRWSKKYLVSRSNTYSAINTSCLTAQSGSERALETIDMPLEWGRKLAQLPITKTASAVSLPVSAGNRGKIRKASRGSVVFNGSESSWRPRQSPVVHSARGSPTFHPPSTKNGTRTQQPQNVASTSSVQKEPSRVTRVTPNYDSKSLHSIVIGDEYPRLRQPRSPTPVSGSQRITELQNASRPNSVWDSRSILAGDEWQSSGGDVSLDSAQDPTSSSCTQTDRTLTPSSSVPIATTPLTITTDDTSCGAFVDQCSKDLQRLWTRHARRFSQLIVEQQQQRRRLELELQHRERRVLLQLRQQLALHFVCDDERREMLSSSTVDSQQPALIQYTHSPKSHPAQRPRTNVPSSTHIVSPESSGDRHQAIDVRSYRRSVDSSTSSQHHSHQSRQSAPQSDLVPTPVARRLHPSSADDTSTGAHSGVVRVPSAALTDDMHRRFCRLTAIARGYLTRRLLRTDKVQSIIYTAREAMRCAVRLQREADATQGNVSAQDLQLYERLINQVYGACYSLHRLCIAAPVSQRMTIIAADRQMLRSAMETQQSQPQQPVNALHLSKATLMALERKRARLSVSSSGGSPRPRSRSVLTHQRRSTRSSRDVMSPLSAGRSRRSRQLAGIYSSAKQLHSAAVESSVTTLISTAQTKSTDGRYASQVTNLARRTPLHVRPWH